MSRILSSISSFLVAVGLAGAAFGQTKADKCPEFDLFTSLNAVVAGDKVSFNIVATGGTLKLSELKFDWRAHSGRLTVSRDTTRATLDTATVKDSWDLVTVDFASFRRCRWSESSGTIHVRKKGPYTKVDDFWWWFQLNSMNLYAFKEPDHGEWLDRLSIWLASVDPNLTYRIDRNETDPNCCFTIFTPTRLVVRYAGTPNNARLVKNIIEKAPKLAGWEFLADSTK